jgi:hypothetical protein
MTTLRQQRVRETRERDECMDQPCSSLLVGILISMLNSVETMPMLSIKIAQTSPHYVS